MLLARIRSLAQGLFGRRGVEREMSDELQFHVDSRADDLMRAQGLERGEALRRARAEFGSIEKYKEEGRQARGLRLLDELRADTRYALRTLNKNRGFALAAIVTLALGIGANTAVFSLFEAILLRPMAAADPDRIVAVYTSDYSSTRYGASSYPDYEDIHQAATVFSDIAAYRQTQLSMNAGADTEMILAEVVTGNYFSLLGVGAQQGRTLAAPDNVPDAAPVVVVSHDFWTRRFGNDPAVIGRTIQLNGQVFAITGVAARGFTGGMRPHSVDAWITVFASRGLYPPERFGWVQNRGSRSLGLLARLRDDATLEKAQAQLSLVAARLYEAYPQEWRNIRNTGRTISVVPESETRVPPDFNGPILGFIALLMIVVGLVLLTACANLANLLLARGAASVREVGMRLALGSSRSRIVRQLLTENILLSIAGGAAGLLVGWALMRVLLYFKPPISVPVALDLRLDAMVLVFTLVVSVLTGIVFGLAPAFHAVHRDLLPVLKDSAAVGSPRRSRLSRAFVVAQVALSVLLLIGAGLFLRSLQIVLAADVGFDPSNTIVMTLSPGLQGYDEPRARDLYEKVLQNVEALPGVQSASLAMTVPLGLMGPRQGTAVEGYEPQPGEDMEFGINRVTPRYFETMRIPVVRGRAFQESDRAESLPVIIVNEAFAQRFWPGVDPLGKRVSANGDLGPFREVIGVVPTGKYNTLGEDPRPFYYVPLWQEHRGAVTLHVRTAADPGALLPSVRAVIRSIDGTVPDDMKTMEDQLLLTLLPARVAGILLGAFGGLALLLASVGIYGLMSYAVAQQTREIGVRLALGAARRDLLRVVVGDGLRLVFIGILIGGAGALTLTGAIAPWLYGITPYDPLAFTGAIVVLASAALLACFLPARRALRIDPVAALRRE